MQTQEQNAALDIQIFAFLKVVSPIIMHPKVEILVEWLIRRFSITQRNVQVLILAIIPYHQTPFFSKIIKISSLDNTWSFLKNMETVTRSVFVQNCLKNHTILTQITEFMAELESSNILHKTYSSFYSCLMIEYVTELTEITDNHLRHLLPSLLHNLSRDDKDIRAASQMVTALISKRVTFTPEVFMEIVDASSKGEMNEQSLQSTIMFFIGLSQCQPQEVIRFSKFALQNLCSLLNQISTIIVAFSKSYEMDAFLTPFLSQLFSEGIMDASMLDVFVDIISSSFLNESTLRKIIHTVFSKISSTKNNQNGIVCLKRIYNQYFKTIDGVVDEILKVLVYTY